MVRHYSLQRFIVLIGLMSLIHLAGCGQHENADAIPLELAGWYAHAALASPEAAQHQLASLIDDLGDEFAKLPAEERARPHARLADYFLWTGAYSDALAERRKSLHILGDADPWMEGHLVYLAAMSSDDALIVSLQDDTASAHGRALARAVRALMGGDAGDLQRLLAGDDLRPGHAIWGNAIIAERANMAGGHGERDIGAALKKIESHLSIGVNEWAVDSQWYLIYRSLVLGIKWHDREIQQEMAEAILRYMDATPAVARGQAQQEVQAILNGIERTPSVSWASE